MRVFRQTYTDRSGQKRDAPKWYLELNFQGHCRRVPAFRERDATDELKRRLERLMDLREVGKTLDRDLERWIDGLPPRIQDRLAVVGLLDARSLAASRPLKDLVSQFHESLVAGSVSGKHVE